MVKCSSPSSDSHSAKISKELGNGNTTGATFKGRGYLVLTGTSPPHFISLLRIDVGDAKENSVVK